MAIKILEVQIEEKTTTDPALTEAKTGLDAADQQLTTLEQTIKRYADQGDFRQANKLQESLEFKQASIAFSLREYEYQTRLATLKELAKTLKAAAKISLGRYIIDLALVPLGITAAILKVPLPITSAQPKS